MTGALPFLRVLPLALAVGCGATAGPPTIEVDRTSCAHCGMLVSEPMFAAAYRTPDGNARVFDDIGCLIASARGDRDRDALVFWFRDAGGGGWMPGSEAVFVRSPDLPTPMGGGLLAYRDATAARRAAEEHRGEVVPSLAALLSAVAPTTKEGGL